jgi:hypothetical protein
MSAFESICRHAAQSEKLLVERRKKCCTVRGGAKCREKFPKTNRGWRGGANGTRLAGASCRTSNSVSTSVSISCSVRRSLVSASSCAEWLVWLR